MSSNEMVEHDNPFAWAWALGTEEAYEEGKCMQHMPGSDISADDDTYRTEALCPVRDNEAYQARPSRPRSLGAHDPRGLFDYGASSAEPDLVSGCRVIEKKEPRSRRKEDPKELHSERYVCLWAPCESKKPTFGRPADLERHYIDKHLRPHVYRCTALVHSKLCGKEYYRPDKFRHHMLTDHPVETEFSCPIDLCEAGPFTYDLWCIHVTSHKSAFVGDTLGVAQSCCVVRGYPISCPVKECDKRLSSFRLTDHLSSHDPNTRYYNREAIRGAGYCEVTGRPLCPICRVSIDQRTETKGVYVEETGRWLRPAALHMYRFHWHEPEMLHKHRRDILKIDPKSGDHHRFIRDKLFKDILATESAKE